MRAQGFVTRAGDRKVLLINKQIRDWAVSVSRAAQGKASFVDQNTGCQPPASVDLENGFVTLHGFAVAVATLAR